MAAYSKRDAILMRDSCFMTVPGYLLSQVVYKYTLACNIAILPVSRVAIKHLAIFFANSRQTDCFTTCLLLRMRARGIIITEAWTGSYEFWRGCQLEFKAELRLEKQTRPKIRR